MAENVFTQMFEALKIINDNIVELSKNVEIMNDKIDKVNRAFIPEPEAKTLKNNRNEK